MRVTTRFSLAGAVAIAITTSIAPASVDAAPPPAVEPSRVAPRALNTVNILMSGPGATAVYGPNELVEIVAGNINYVGGKVSVGREVVGACEAHPVLSGKRSKKGVEDYLQPFADVYMVPAGQQPSNGETLSDLNGQPNTVIGSLGGSFVYEPLGVTFPSGKIGAGVYALVVDECQNGVFDTGEDSYIDDAFWVDLDQDVPALSTGASSFLTAKSRAGRLATSLHGVKQLLKFKEALDKAQKTLKLAAAAVSPEAMVTMVLTEVLSKIQEPTLKEGELILKTMFTQFEKRAKGLAADPPQTDFRRHAVPVVAGASFEDRTDEYGAATMAYASVLDALSGLSGAILDAVERYQGADLRGDGQWAIRHAERVEALTTLYTELLDDLDAAEARLLGAIQAQHQDGPPSQDYQHAIFMLRLQTAAESLNANSTYTYELQPDVRNTGIDPAAARPTLDYWLDQVHSSERPGGTADWQAPIEAATDSLHEFADSFPGLVAQFDPMIAELAADAPTYGNVDDSPITITATGAVRAGDDVALSAVVPAGSFVEWDLDGDGEFDDATGEAVTWTVPGDAMVAAPLFVSAQYSFLKEAGVTTELFMVESGGNRPPDVDDTPTSFVGAPGETASFDPAASDPDGDSLTYTWFVDGVEAGTGATFDYPTPSDRLVTHAVEVVVSDGQAATRRLYLIETRTADADNDGYMAAPGPDCHDATHLGVLGQLINPNRSEVTGNGVDDNCNGQIDEPVPATISIPGVAAPGTRVTVGTQVELDVVNWTHGRRNTGDVFEFTVDWGEAVDTFTVAQDTNTPEDETDIDIVSHIYEHPVESQTVSVCGRRLGDPSDPQNATFCNTGKRVDVHPDRPLVNADDLRDVDVYRLLGRGVSVSPVGDWAPVDPHGHAVRSVGNPSEYVIADTGDELGIDGYGRVSMIFSVLATGDDDTVGLLFGFDPDDDTEPHDTLATHVQAAPNSEFHGVRWSNDSQTLTNYPCNDDEDLSSRFHPDPLTAFHFVGEPIWWEMSKLIDLAEPYDPSDDAAEGEGPQDPGCDDSPNGVPPFAAVPTGADPDVLVGADQWEPRSWDASQNGRNPDPYLVEVDYQPYSFTVWIDGVEQFQYDKPQGEDPFPPSDVAFFYSSQNSLEVSISTTAPTFQFEQGKGGEFWRTDPITGDPVDPDGIVMSMIDGAHDDQTAVVHWGDGTNSAEGVVAPGGVAGEFSIAADHVYDEAGEFVGEVCVTDQRGFSNCGQFRAVVTNAAPQVHAGRDLAADAAVDLDDMGFQDPGSADTHTATIDWGDGSVEAGLITGERGGGVVSGSHTYASSGSYTVELCVTDQHGATGCDDREITIDATEYAPEADADDAEGDVDEPVDVLVGFTDLDQDDGHTATIDWGDGSGVGPLEMSVGQGCEDADEAPGVQLACRTVGVAQPSHTYAAAGIFDVVVEVCDVTDRCDQASASVVIADTGPDVPAAPAAPSGVPGDGTVAVSWTAPADDGGSSITGYVVSASPGGASCTTGGALTCVVSGLTNGTPYTFRVRATNGVGTGPWSAPSTAVTPTSSEPDPVPFLVSLTPARLLETRDGVGLSTVDGAHEGVGVRPAGDVYVLPVVGRGGVPSSGVDAAVLNVGAVRPSGNGHVTVYPCGEKPVASSLNFLDANNPNEVIAKLSGSGSVCLFTSTPTDLIVDVTGYVPEGSDYVSLTPARLLETRDGVGLSTVDGAHEGVGVRPAGDVYVLPVVGRGGVPSSGVDAAVLNVGAVRPSGNGHVTVYPCGEKPVASSLNFLDANNPNEVIAKLSGSGSVCLFTSTPTDLIVDVTGYVELLD